MKLNTKLKVRGHNVAVNMDVQITTSTLTRDESFYEQKKLNDLLFNAMRQYGFHTQDISLK